MKIIVSFSLTIVAFFGLSYFISALFFRADLVATLSIFVYWMLLFLSALFISVINYIRVMHLRVVLLERKIAFLYEERDDD
jgi:hypothetical protein